MKQVFYLHPQDKGYIITDGELSNTLAVNDLEAVKTLYTRLGALLMGGQDDGTLFMPEPVQQDLIGTIEARQIATADGYNLAVSTLNTACERGTIRGATKDSLTEKARWRMPRQNFMYWYAGWKASKERGSRRGALSRFGRQKPADPPHAG